MQAYICTTCGVQYEKRETVPPSCLICEDERQYVPANGQTWTRFEEINQDYENKIKEEERNLFSIHTTPKFGIGQTAYLVQANGFNVLWDCVSVLDDRTVKAINDLGGIDAIALSHPHYYSTQVEWAETFQAPVYIHEDDAAWITRDSDWITLWSEEELELTSNVKIVRLGGHFQGGAVLNWTTGNDHKGVLLTGDIIQVVADTDWVSFMYSYPNLIPLPASKVEEMALQTKQLHFDRIYNAFHKIVKQHGKEVIQQSATRYIKALNGSLFHT